MKSMVILADGSFVVETVGLALRNAAGANVIERIDGRAPVGAVIGEAKPDIVVIGNEGAA
jgi:hypothetical protein